MSPKPPAVFSKVLEGLRVVAIAMLLLSLGGGSRDFFLLLRWVVTAAAVVMALVAWSDRDRLWVGVLVLLAVLFNPVIPVELDRDVWKLLDVATAAVFVGSYWAVVRFLPPRETA